MRKTTRLTRLLACTALASGMPGALCAAELLQPPSIDDMSVYAAGVSADGSVVVGTLNPGQSWTRSGFVWTQAGGMQRVGGASAGSMLNERFTATGVSNDGTVIVGQASPDMLPGGPFTARAYWWTAVDGFVDLGGLPGALPTSNANGVSGDGQVVVGEAPNAAGAARGFRWTREGGMVDLGELPGMITLGAVAASYDGSVIVGNAAGEYGLGAQGFRWTENGIELLAKLNGGYPSAIATQSFVRDISDDGRVIVGQASNGTTGRSSATRWMDGVAEDLYTPGSGLGDNYSFAYGVSGNGEVVVGEARVDNTMAVRGFRWTEKGGMQTIGQWLTASGATIVSDITYAARAANCDGSVIVGETAHYSEKQSRLFIARGNGTGQNNCQMAGEPGGNEPGGNEPGGNEPGGNEPGGNEPGGSEPGGNEPSGNQPGGNEPGGNEPGGNQPGGNEPGGNEPGDNAGNGGNGGGVPPGLILLADLDATLADAAGANTAMLSATLGDLNLLLNGAGSRPLDRRADPGKSIAWIGGDLGRVKGDRTAGDGAAGLGEIGVGYNFGSVQLNGVLGFTRFDHATAYGGGSDLSAAYVKAEALTRLYATDEGGLWAAVTASALHGEADITRRYIVNGGLIDGSQASTDVSGYGLRGRLQWENAIRHVSPYADLSYARGCVDGYRETGGPFPAAFDKLCDSSTELRYGFDVTYPLTQAFRLIGTLEGVHRFESRSANVTGQVIGLGAFDLGGIKHEQDWLRAGAGFETSLGPSTLSVMGNVTTQSSGVNAWAAASWRVKF